MKVLMITPYVTIVGKREFERNKTGFGYMVFDIAKAVGNKAGVSLLATDSCGSAFELKNVLFLKRSWWLMLRYLFRCVKPKMLCDLLKRYQLNKGARLRLWYYWLMSGYVDKLVEGGGYDVVHIHGCGYADELWMRVCKKCQQKFVVTLHGLNSFSDSVKISHSGKRYERDFLTRVVAGEIPITVISTGMKRTIEKAYNINGCRNITVVCNSFSMTKDVMDSFSVRENYGIPIDGRIILYVGNLSVNKNQIQMIEAFGLLPKELCQNTWVLFCGNNHMHDSSLETTISQSCYSNHLILCGGVEKDLMSSYYKEADAVVLLSKSEGFGLSLIEGMHFGLPCAMFRDLDAFWDIYDSSAVVPIENRDNPSVATAIEELLTTRWNVQDIKKSSKRFESQTMADKYKKVYELL